ncbi:DMT family transporter [Vibrio mangrovi]|uniref:DMT family transporter n=1 Tax=Vibrio mangrovi TaxID=474394 RepID=A0A1Y6IW06_9VIBR|nr:DMT family transporter [Vibrio mangrovi]MDW6005076.1 DMT family transporter [Vibrio mangrovi]SMS01844.1 putative inner membrane transporter YhbE [Vibrio mangrovi]
MANISRKFMYGLLLSCTTMIAWGMIAIALKLSNDFADPVTLTWLRFTVAGVIVWLWQKRHNRLVQFRRLERSDWLRLSLAGVLLMINYTCYAWSLVYLTPDSSQLSMQMAPLFLAVGGAVFFKEYISWQQWVCFALLLTGLLVFFHPVLQSGSGQETTVLLTGLTIIFVSALAWSLYALVQKSLFQQLDASNILLGIYLMAMVVMFPLTSPSDLLQMSFEEWLIALFCCLNTVVAYGAFAKSLTYWKTVQVSSVIAVTPVMAFLLTELCMTMGWWTGIIHSAQADWLSLSGMGLVIVAAIGVQLVSVSRRKPDVSDVTEPSAA